MNSKSTPSRHALQEWIREYLANASGLPLDAIGLDDPFEQFAIDSEGILDFVMAIEEQAQLSTNLDLELVFRYRTIRILLDHLDELRHRSGDTR